MARGGWNLDIETRCMQEVVDAGEGPPPIRFPPGPRPKLDLMHVDREQLT